jgi:hypothetical protein
MTSPTPRLYEVSFASWTTFSLTIEAASMSDALARGQAIYNREGEFGFTEAGGGTEPLRARWLSISNTKGTQS